MSSGLVSKTYTLFVDRMNIIGGKITISKAKRNLGSEITAAEENTDDISPKAAVIPVSCHPVEGNDADQRTAAMKTPRTSELNGLDSDPNEDTVTRKVIEKLISEMLDQCVDEEDFTNVDDSEEKLNDAQTADQVNVVPSNSDRRVVPRAVTDVTSH